MPPNELLPPIRQKDGGHKMREAGSGSVLSDGFAKPNDVL